MYMETYPGGMWVHQLALQGSRSSPSHNAETLEWIWKPLMNGQRQLWTRVGYHGEKLINLWPRVPFVCGPLKGEEKTGCKIRNTQRR